MRSIAPVGRCRCWRAGRPWLRCVQRVFASNADGETRRSRPRAGSAAELGVHDYVFLTVKAQMLPDLAPVLGPAHRSRHRGHQRHQRHSVVVLPRFRRPVGESVARVRRSRTGRRSAPFRGSASWVRWCMRRRGFWRRRMCRWWPLIACFSANRAAKSRSALQAVAAGLRGGGINAEISRRIRHDVWAKLWGNMNMNPLSALTRCGTAKCSPTRMCANFACG